MSLGEARRQLINLEKIVIFLLKSFDVTFTMTSNPDLSFAKPKIVFMVIREREEQKRKREKGL